MESVAPDQEISCVSALMAAKSAHGPREHGTLLESAQDGPRFASGVDLSVAVLAALEQIPRAVTLGVLHRTYPGRNSIVPGNDAGSDTCRHMTSDDREVMASVSSMSAWGHPARASSLTACQSAAYPASDADRRRCRVDDPHFCGPDNGQCCHQSDVVRGVRWYSSVALCLPPWPSW